MATNYFATTYNDNQVFIPGIIGAFARPFSFNIGTGTVPVNTGLVLNDTVALCPIPFKSGAGGVMVIGYQIEIPSLDTGTSVVLGLGDNNGAAGIFQATYVTGAGVGINAKGVLHPLMCFTGTTAVAPVRGAIPRSYTTFTGATTAWQDLNFILKVTTAPNTSTTTGLITGYLLMQPLGTQAVTYLNGASN